MPGFNDNETTAEKIADSFHDPRVRHFYDPFPAHRAGKAFAKELLSQGPAWDIYLFYEKGLMWGSLPPKPTEWMHQLGGGRRADPAHFHSGSDLIEQLPADIDYSEDQATQIGTLAEAVEESEPQTLKELAVKITTLERAYEGAEVTVPFEIIAKDIRQLAGED